MAKSKVADDFHENESGVTGQYKTWFLDYASYVILERAVPAMDDGLKPVQRRILRRRLDDLPDRRPGRIRRRPLPRSPGCSSRCSSRSQLCSLVRRSGRD